MDDELSESTTHDDVETLFNLVRNEELSNASSLEKLKKSVKEKLEALITDVEKCTDYEALQEFRKGISAKQCLLRSMVENPRMPTLLGEGSKLPHNKNIETQKRFYSTKKKRKRCERVKFSKPTSEEKENILKDRRGIQHETVDKEFEDWTCHQCRKSREMDMIQCDTCDNWFDWECAGIIKEPDDWSCDACNN